MQDEISTEREEDEAKSSAPSLAAVLTLRDMVIYLTETDISRGKSYQREGRVRDLAFSPDFTSVTASVEGTALKPYRQTITLAPTPGERTKIEGYCTCPVGFNCKHVAAVLLDCLTRKIPKQPLPVQRFLIPPPQADPPVPIPPPEPALPYEISSWLDQMAMNSGHNDYPPEFNQRLVYVLTAYTAPNSSPHLAVDVITARLLKSGSFSDSITRPGLSNFYMGTWPRYFRPSDVEICEALISSRSAHSSNSYSISSMTLWKSIIATGRAYWQSHQTAPLTVGDSRVGHIEWLMPDARGMRPILNVGGAVALNAEPPVYIDVPAGLIGEVSLPLEPKLAHRLLNAPAIAPAFVNRVSQTLGRYLPAGTDLIPKAPAPPVLVEDPPVPVIHLMRANQGHTNYQLAQAGMPVARLLFRYGPVKVALGETSPFVESISASKRYRAKRQPSKEKEFLARLFDLEFRFAREIYIPIGPSHQQDLAFSDPFLWLSFLSQDVPKLRDQGFEIIIDDDFPYRLVTPSGDVDTEFTPGRSIDWFELGLGVTVDGHKIDLAPMLANLVLTDGLDPEAVRALADDGDDIYIPLDDGRHLALAAKRYLPVIIALHDLTMGGSVVEKNGRLQVSKAEASLLSVLEGQEGIVFRGGENLRRMVRALSQNTSSDMAPVALPNTFSATLRPYQTEGVAWLNLLREVGLGGILADDMGLGKTVQILALLCFEKAQGRLDKPALIIAPTSLMSNWQNEARRFAPDLSVLLLHGAARKDRFEEISQHDIVLTTYPLIARDQLVLLERSWHMAILDEAQIIKNPNAATTRLIRELKARHRFCLTGTPMENHLGELWSLMSFVNPGYLGDKSSFGRRWRTPIEKHADVERSQILARRVKPFMLRRTKQEVASELPPKTEITESITLEEKQRDVYDSIRLAMHKKVRQAIAAKGLSKSHIVILEALLKLRQVCCDPRLLKLTGSNPPPSAKLERLMEMLEELLAEGRKIIVFSQFTSMLELITHRLNSAAITFSLLTGQTQDRRLAVETFQSGQVNVFLVSLKAGGVGLNLTAADTVILYDPWWNPAVEEQAIDRAYRIGQDKPVFVYRLVASQTIEEKMDELKAKKRALAESLFDQTGNPGTALTEEDIETLLDA